MALTDYQRAGLRHHKHSAADIIDPETAEPITEGGLGGGDVAAADIADATEVGVALITAADAAAVADTHEHLTGGSGVGDKLFLAANYR